MSHVTHYGIGAKESPDSACGRYSLWHAGLAWTREPRRVTCLRCRKSPIYDEALRRNVTPTSQETT